MAERVNEQKAGSMIRRRGVAVVLWVSWWLVLVRPSVAQMGTCLMGGVLEPVAYETVTVSNVAVGLTASLLNAASATAAWVTIESQPLRYKLSGTPTATEGHLVEPPSQGNMDAGKGAWFCGQKTLTLLRMIRSSGTDSIMRVTYFRLP